MESLPVSRSGPDNNELAELRRKAERVANLIHGEDCEASKPFFFEFAGTPKSGKSSIIGIVSHFLRRAELSVVQPAEGASLRTPETLRDDWLAFNAWSACYALRHILEISHEREPPDVVLLDRGLFDATAWMTFLQASQARLSEDDRNVIDRFLTLDLWCRREVCVFLFSADHETSLNRESSFKLIESHGSVMNPDVIGKLNDAYTLAADRQCSRFTIVRVDTSFMNGETPSFQRIAFVVAERILDMMHTLLDQRLLVTEPLGFEGLTDSPEETEAVLGRILNDGNPRFMERSAAEASGTYVQVVPYAYLKDAAGRYFIARRRADHPRTELRGTYTMLAGGHAEQKDWDSSDPAGVFERCLRRELDEELIGLEIRSVRRVGVINDSRSSVGTHHLAILFEVEVGGAPKVRRQASDQEFGREAVSWKTGQEIGRFVADLDPWSQLVAAREFKLPVPELPNEPTLFTRGMQK